MTTHADQQVAAGESRVTENSATPEHAPGSAASAMRLRADARKMEVARKIRAVSEAMLSHLTDLISAADEAEKVHGATDSVDDALRRLADSTRSVNRLSVEMGKNRRDLDDYLGIEQP